MSGINPLRVINPPQIVANEELANISTADRVNSLFSIIAPLYNCNIYNRLICCNI